MAIADEIKRIQDAKASIKSSIENKGVSVPSDAKLETYASYISSIEGGGGGSQSFKYVDNTEFDDYGRLTKMRFIGSNVPMNLFRYMPLEYAELTDSVTSIGDSAFQNTNIKTISIPNGVPNIGNYTFNNCLNLTSIDIPNSVTIFGNNAFAGCDKLTSINIPNGTTNIDGYAFSRCSSLTSIEIPSNVNNIGTYAFQNCSGLTKIIIYADTPPTLGNGAFTGTSMSPIHVPNNSVNTYKTATNWTPYANRIVPIGWEYDYSSGTEFRYTGDTGTTEFTHINSNVITSGDVRTKSYTSLITAYIGDNVTEIGINAFQFCSNLFYVNFSDNSRLETINEAAFQNCSNLRSIKIPNGVTSIGLNGFTNCNYIKTLEIPSGVNSIGNGAFTNCNRLTSMTVYANTPPTLGTNAFMATTCTIYVPDASVDAYKTATNWSSYATRIKPLSEKPQ